MGFPHVSDEALSPHPTQGRPSEPTLLVLDADPPPRLESLAGRARVLHADAASLASLLPEADVLLVWDFLSDAVREAWPGPGARPGWVHTASAGADRLICPELVASDTVVTNARGVFDQPIAEYVAALVLAFAKDLPRTLELGAAREWRHRETQRVAGTRACVVGSGPIGRAISRVLTALGVHVSVVGRTARNGIHGQDELDGLLAASDWVVCAAPLTDETRGLFDAGRFARMRESACFVNIGRGAHVVEPDLAEALAAGRIAGAALDVFAEEPLPATQPPVGGARPGRLPAHERRHRRLARRTGRAVPGAVRPVGGGPAAAERGRQGARVCPGRLTGRACGTATARPPHGRAEPPYGTDRLHPVPRGPANPRRGG
ncbi:Phosphoglycerate dehydrogenase [Streptomyces sp. IgraMP-1]|nr:Phosphoglycerate dehydrogenase [Streptomyces sp. IgraMP-1]